jgi:hypothetical protein
VECPKYPGFCLTRQKNEYPFVEAFYNPEQVIILHFTHNAFKCFDFFIETYIIESDSVYLCWLFCVTNFVLTRTIGNGIMDYFVIAKLFFLFCELSTMEFRDFQSSNRN